MPPDVILIGGAPAHSRRGLTLPVTQPYELALLTAPGRSAPDRPERLTLRECVGAGWAFASPF